MIRFDFLRMHEKNTTITPNCLGKVTKMHNSQDVTMVNGKNTVFKYTGAKLITFATRENNIWHHVFQTQNPTPLILC